MENSQGDGNKKRPHHLIQTNNNNTNNNVSNSSLSPIPMARNSNLSPGPDNKSVDAAVLQYQNQKLVQLLDKQKHELHDLESKMQELKEKQSSYDDMLMTVDQLWNELVDDLVLLGVRAGGGQKVFQSLDAGDCCQGSIPPCPPEDVFLFRLLKFVSVEGGGGDDLIKFVEEALAKRRSSTLELFKCLEDIFKDQITKIKSIQNLHGNLSAEDCIAQLNKMNNLMLEDAKGLREVIDGLHQKHKEYTDRIQNYVLNQTVDQAEIKRLAGDLDESMAELEDSRRKLVSLRMQKNAASQAYSAVSCAVNGHLSPEKQPDKTVGLQELKESVEEAEIVAAERLAELEDAREDNTIMSKQLEDLENDIKDEKFVLSSRMYNLLNDQLHHWKAEVVKYKSLTDSLQSERSYLLRREKELELKADSADAAKSACGTSESKVEGLEQKLQDIVLENNDLEAKLEETLQDTGRNDIKAEFNVMASALSKEMGMVEAQLKRWKDTAEEALSLREEVESRKVLLSRKTSEVNSLADKCAQQTAETKSLKEMIEKLQKEKLELQIFLDMYVQGSYDNRDCMEIQESERRACMQAEALKYALGEHNLELRIKAANEAEAACQQRLSSAEAEIADLWVKLDATERDVHELTEAIKMKDAEAEAYISEIETIGQAYEDMQTQNQHLQQQMAERDEYNIKLVSESVKMKQATASLLSEKQALTKQFQLVDVSVQSLRAKILQSEEQLKAVMLEAINSCQEDRHLTISLETARWELADTEKELKWLKSTMASSEKEYEQIQRKIAETQKVLDCERDDRQKLEDDLREWNDKVAEMTAETGEAAVQKLEEEIKDCKAILKCGVCFDRPKEVVIVKCYHLFCNQCIQRNLEIRHRKCPACGTAFGQNDVRFVKI